MRRRLVNRTAAVGIALGMLWLAAVAALATPLVSESFTHATVSDPNWVAGGTNFTACLTAGSNTTQTPVPGCGGTTDPDGSGVLRITQAVNSQAGFLLYNKAQPFTAGLTVDFNAYQWGGNGADGISFFLVDGSTNLTQPGTPGGALGYSASGSSSPGVSHGFIGIGFDAFGNYITNGADGVGCTPQNNAQAPSVAIRGPGNGTSGYCLLAKNTSLPGSLRGTTRTNSKRPVHIVIDPSTAVTPKVTVSMDFGSGLVQVLQTALPASPPATFKFGWAGSTGGLNDFHEISDLVSSTQLALPKLTLAKSHTGNFVRGATASYTLTVATTASAGPELQPITVTDSLPSGLTASAAPSGTGWDCSATTVGSSSVSCTYAASVSSPVAPGTTLPPVQVPVAIGASTASSVTNTASANSGDNTGGPATASDTAAVTSAASPTPVALPRAGGSRVSGNLPAGPLAALLLAAGGALTVRRRLTRR